MPHLLKSLGMQIPAFFAAAWGHEEAACGGPVPPVGAADLAVAAAGKGLAGRAVLDRGEP